VNLLWWLPRLARRWIAQADKIICVSRRQAEIISDLAPELKNKVEVVYNPIPPELASIEPSKNLEDTPTILYTGGDSYVKGFHIILQALKEIGKQSIKIKFIFINHYGYKSLKALKGLSEKYENLEIKAIGKIKHEEVINLHKQTWALAFPSICEEPLPYAVVEAILLNTIPVTSGVGGVVEVLDNVLAPKFMFRPNNVTEAIEKCKEICLLSPSELITFGYKLRSEILKKFNPDELGRNFLKIYKNMTYG
jgi:glycosyltransferase involved in cell wall biosynthesis